jgi:hypothetical protein
MKKFFILLFMGSIMISCRKEQSSIKKNEQVVLGNTVVVPGELSESSYNTFYGPVVQMGNGRARSWINVSHNNEALAIGVEMTHGALENLPGDPDDFEEASFLLPLHLKAKQLTAYDHIFINWNVHGHEPPGIYDVPHFDFHFYKMTLAEQMAIPPYNVAPLLFDTDPPAGYMPGLYFHGPGGVPQMGAHWVDLLTPELYGQPFTHTLIYGTYNGKVTFHEPMVTLATISGGATIHKEIRQPLYFSPTNKYYPTRYSIWQDNSTNNHYLSLDEMVWR